MLMTTHSAPLTASLWQVDDQGNVIGKPIKYLCPLHDVHDCYRAIVAKGHTSSRNLRITEAGKRPDGLGYRK